MLQSSQKSEAKRYWGQNIYEIFCPTHHIISDDKLIASHSLELSADMDAHLLLSTLLSFCVLVTSTQMIEKPPPVFAEIKDPNLQDISGVEIDLDVYQLNILSGMRDIPNLKQYNKLNILYLNSASLENPGTPLHNLLPEGITQLTVTSQMITVYPDASGLPNLTSLYLDNCNLQNSNDLDQNRLPPNLQLFSLAKNQLTSIPDLNQMGKLKYLFLQENKIKQDSGTVRLPNSLRNLDLNGNRYSGLPDLSSLPTLHSLRIQNNSIQEVNAVKLPSSLKDLYLDQNPLHSLPNLQRLENLQYLYASGCRIVDSTAPLSELLPASLKSVTLNQNDITKLPDLQGEHFI